ncbi:MAG: DUF4390 domain-containing protein, partial [Proteobacteria bacterium]|nr:DUF4390 domain-containing protein [Pseudomonadota bacterium]
MAVSVNTKTNLCNATAPGPARPALLLLFITLLYSFIVVASFSIKHMDVNLRKDGLELSGQLDLDLSRKTEEALDKGIPLEIIFDFNIYRERSFIWDEKLNSWQLRRKILFHAISNQYLITTRLPDAEPTQESFPSLQEALAGMGGFDSIELKLDDNNVGTDIIQNTDSPLYLDIRARLDIESLPTPLRPVAYTSRSWRLNSGWSSWSV